MIIFGSRIEDPMMLLSDSPLKFKNLSQGIISRGIV